MAYDGGDGIENRSVHTLETKDVLNYLGTSCDGLSNKDAGDRLKTYGANRLPAAAKRSAFMRFVMQFHNILIYVLLGAVFITALLDHWVDSGVILAVILVNAIIGFIQEGKAEKAMEAIRHMLAPRASVLRDGRRQNIAGEQLVPGDIILLEAGDKVPADLRLLQARGLQIQEAILTGESVAVEKDTERVGENAPLGDRSCMAFSGTIVTAGQGQGVVATTGARTEIGRISGMLSEVEVLTTPLVRQMGVFAKYLTVFILGLSAVILAFGYFVKNMPFTELFMVVVGLSVAAIPEGLPAVLTITLAVGVQVMARRNAIVRRLPAIETLGSVSVICTDKTGTLTHNEMVVASVLTSATTFTIKGEGYAPYGEITGGDKEELNDLALAAALCNDAAIHEKEGVWCTEGDPMECALLAFSGKAGVDWQGEQKHWARTDIIPFDSKTRFMATLNHNHEGQAFIFVKGAPERLLEMCALQKQRDGQEVPLNAEYWHSEAENIANQGQRVLAFALKPIKPEHTVLELTNLEDGLVLLGMTGMIDPPRPEAIEAIADCHGAGIRVKMITGDHAGTAAAIAGQIGLQNTEKVLTGADLDQMDDDGLKAAVLETDIFARTSPEHKLRLVMGLQAHRLSVAMTGDGVNDAPALKRANAGIAMGQKGSEATKEAADFVLADDNFASIAAAVREGRTVYDNLKKVISFLLPVNGGESLSLIIAILLGLTLPITPVQILWINMVSSVALAMALAFEPPESQVMKKAPRRIDAPILSKFLIWRITFVSILFSCGVFGQFLLAQFQGVDLETARTMTVNTLVVMEIFYLFSVRYTHGTSFTVRGLMGTNAVLWAVGIVTALQFLFTYAPFMQLFFDAQPLAILQGIQVIGFGLAVLCILEVEKLIVRKVDAQEAGAG